MFNSCADHLRWKVIETQAEILLHTGDCENYSYFFENDQAKSIKHPCLLGYKNWTLGMVDRYLQKFLKSCEFCMPKIDYNVIEYWEGSRIQPSSPKILYVKQRIEKHWNNVRHLAQQVLDHSVECKRFKKENGKFGCLEILHINFTNWEDRELIEYYESKTKCNF